MANGHKYGNENKKTGKKAQINKINKLLQAESI